MRIESRHLNLVAFGRFIEESMDGYFNGQGVSLVKEKMVELLELDAHRPDLITPTIGTTFFAPYTVSDMEGGMVYGDGSSVCFTSGDNDAPRFGDVDCYGYSISKTEEGWLIQSARCATVTTGPCSCHYMELIVEVPASDELIERMMNAIKPFIGSPSLTNSSSVRT